MEIHDIKNKDLIYFGERIEPYFASSIIIRGMLKKENITKILGWETGVRWMYTSNYFFIKKTDLDKAKKILKTKFQNKGEIYTKKLIKKCFEYGDKLIKVSKNIERQTKKENLDKNEMHDLLNKYTTAASNYMIFQNIALFEDSISELVHKLVKKYSKNENEANTLLEVITTANRLTGGEKEQDDFLHLCTQKNKKELTEQHAKKYGWLSLRFFVGKPWNSEDVLLRVKNCQPAKAKAELNKRINDRKQKEKQIKKATKNFNTEDRSAAELIRDIVFLRTQRTDFFQESSYYVQPLIGKIAAKLKVSYDDLLYLSASEISLSLKEKFDYLSHIKKRQKGFLVFFDYNKDNVLESDDALKYIREQSLLNKNQSGAKEIKGKTAFIGSATGKVKILKSDKDNNKVEKGDIVVAVMTTPNFIPALEKAAAFVTDEGGITCHAAIIAREMKKPCIIGTKIATISLKDGDMVKVDADNGIVHIIKNT